MAQLRHLIFGKFGVPDDGITDSKDYSIRVYGGEDLALIERKNEKIKNKINNSYKRIHYFINDMPFPELIIKECDDQNVPFYVYARLYPVFKGASGDVPGIFHAFILGEEEMAKLDYKPWVLNRYFIKSFEKGQIVSYDDSVWLTEANSKRNGDPPYIGLKYDFEELKRYTNKNNKFHEREQKIYVINGDRSYDYLENLSSDKLDAMYASGVFLFANPQMLEKIDGSICKFVFTNGQKIQQLPSEVVHEGFDLENWRPIEISKERWHVTTREQNSINQGNRVTLGSQSLQNSVPDLATGHSLPPTKDSGILLSNPTDPDKSNNQINAERKSKEEEGNGQIGEIKEHMSRLAASIESQEEQFKNIMQKFNAIENEYSTFTQSIEKDKKKQYLIFAGILVLVMIVGLFAGWIIRPDKKPVDPTEQPKKNVNQPPSPSKTETSKSDVVKTADSAVISGGDGTPKTGAPTGSALIPSAKPSGSSGATAQVPKKKPPVNGRSATNQQVDKRPVTNPPVTNPPVTNPPVTNPPVTNPPVTNPPTTTKENVPKVKRDSSGH